MTDIGTYQATTPRSSGGHFKGQALRHHGPPELHGLVVVEQVGGGRVVVQGGRVVVQGGQVVVQGGWVVVQGGSLVGGCPLSASSSPRHRHSEGSDV